MEVRSRNFTGNSRDLDRDDPAGKKSRNHLCSRIFREFSELSRTAARLFKGRGSNLAYLFIPAFISLLWLLLAFLTTRTPSMSLEERLSQQYLKVRFKS